MSAVTVFGSSNIDMVLSVDEMPKLGETIRSKSMSYIPGGKGANQACACGKLGGSCTFLSSIGNDENGKKLLKSLLDAGVDCTRIQICKNETTGMAIIPVDKNGENSIIIVRGANGNCDNDYYKEIEEEISKSKVLLTQLETPIETVFLAIEEAKSKGVTTILNPAPAVTDIPDKVFACIDYFTPNETELEKITGIATTDENAIKAAAGKLLAKGVKTVIVTVGSNGAYFINKDGMNHFPAFPTKAVDTTAAGDTFNAGLAVCLAEGKTLSEAVIFGNAAASISVSRHGAQTSIPTRAEVEKLLNKNKGNKEKNGC